MQFEDYSHIRDRHTSLAALEIKSVFSCASEAHVCTKKKQQKHSTLQLSSSSAVSTVGVKWLGAF